MSRLLETWVVALSTTCPLAAWAATPPLLLRANGDTGPYIAALYTEGDGPIVPAGADLETGVRAALTTHFGQEASRLGLVNGTDIFPLKFVGTVAEVTEELEETLHGASRTEFTPVVGNSLVVEEGAVVVTVVGGRIVSVLGTPISRSVTEHDFSALLAAPSVAYEQARASVKALCANFLEPEPGVEHVSFERAVRYYIFGCDGDRVDWDSVADTEVRRGRTESEDWSQFVPVAGVRGLPLGPSVPVPGVPWIYTSSPVAPSQVYYGIRIDKLTTYPPPTPCEYKLSVGTGSDGGDSSFPFPTTVLNDAAWGYRASGSCITGDAFLSPPTLVSGFHVQNVHVQAERMAHATRRDTASGLLRVMSGAMSHPLEIHLYMTQDECGGGGGRYAWPTERLCVDRTRYRAGWGTVPHEYGHYITDIYTNLGTPWLNCEREAVYEGVADALNISLLHRVMSGFGSFSASQLNAIFVAEPGLSRSGSPTAPSFSVQPPYVSVATTCDVPPTGAYQKGFALVELMWRLVNTRACSNSQGNCAMIPLNGRLGFLGRKSFTMSLARIGVIPINVRSFASDWKNNLRALLRQEGLLTSQVASEVNNAFAQHGI